MSRYFLIISLIISFLCLGISCSNTDDAQKRFESESFRTPSGITKTNGIGEIINKDDGDWNISPFHSSLVEFNRYPFPNPAGNEFITLELFVRSNVGLEGLLIYTETKLGYQKTVYNSPQIQLGIGFHEVKIPSYKFSDYDTYMDAKGLYRIWLIDLQGRIISYGDIQIQ